MEDMAPHVTVDSLAAIQYETKQYEDSLEKELEVGAAPRMFSLNQIRELFFMHLHRSELKQTVEVSHEFRMDDLKDFITRVQTHSDQVKDLIYVEKKHLSEQIEHIRNEDNTSKMRIAIELNDLSAKVGLVVKEMKASSQMVKLGEKQIDTITEKMDGLKTENIKFKNNMKQKFYDIEVRTFLSELLFRKSSMRTRRLGTRICSG